MATAPDNAARTPTAGPKACRKACEEIQGLIPRMESLNRKPADARKLMERHLQDLKRELLNVM